MGLVAITSLFFVPAASAATQPPRSALDRLVEDYSPVTMIREQQDPPCEITAEQYEPTSVDTVLGNPSVILTRDVGGKGLTDVLRAPTADDIAGLGDRYYLNLNGDPLGDTCEYARDFEVLKDRGDAPVVTYAHIARERGHPGFALQYWFYWYFNEFNDLHESDWEGMQLSFDTDSPRQALVDGPSRMILFQHAGGERADWNDSKVQKDGSHPIVYPAAGSHATFYGSAVYVENGERGSGLGCDNTSQPLRELRPQPILMPDRVPSRGEFKWLSFYGRWGEKQKGFNNGPTGPQTKTQWNQPFSWMEGQRSTSPRLPGGSVLGPQVAKAFCGTVGTVSGLINLEAKSRLAAVVTLVLLAILIVLFAGATRWGPIDLTELRARRSFGQLVRTARRLYGRHWLVVVPITLTAVPIIGGTNLLAGEFAGGSNAGGVSDRSGIELAIADLIGQIGRPIAMAIVAAVVVTFVRLLAEGRPAGFVDSWRAMLQRFWRVVIAQLIATLGVTLIFITVIGIPFAIWKLVSWTFVQQEVLFTDKSIREAFRGSSELVRGRWWHTVRAVVFFNLVAIVTGPLLTFALIFTSLSLIWINLLGSLVFALLIAYVAIGDTLLYFDLEARAEAEPAKPRRSWRPWRPRKFGRVPDIAAGAPAG